MGNLVLDMSMSLDGFIAGPDDGPDNGLGIAGHWDGDHHDGVPIFVPTHRAPDNPPTGVATITYVTDGIESAVAQAKTAAGDRNVMLHGADTVQRCLQAGVLDEMEIHVVPVLLGQGRRLFDHLRADHIVLELSRIVDAPGVTHLHYRIRYGRETRSSGASSPSVTTTHHSCYSRAVRELSWPEARCERLAAGGMVAQVAALSIRARSWHSLWPDSVR